MSLLRKHQLEIMGFSTHQLEVVGFSEDAMDGWCFSFSHIHWSIHIESAFLFVFQTFLSVSEVGYPKQKCTVFKLCVQHCLYLISYFLSYSIELTLIRVSATPCFFIFFMPNILTLKEHIRMGGLASSLLSFTAWLLYTTASNTSSILKRIGQFMVALLEKNDKFSSIDCWRSSLYQRDMKW